MVVVSLLAPPAGAVSTLLFTTKYESSGGVVFANDTPIVRTWDKSTADAVIADRLREAANRGAKPSEFAVESRRGIWQLLYRDTLIATATSTRAKKAKVKPAALARAWLAGVHSAFSRPYISVPQSFLRAPLGDELHVPVLGNLPPALRAGGYDPSMVTVTAAPDGRELIVFGQRLGQTTLRIAAADLGLTLYVHVMEGAALIPNRVTAIVTGAEVPAETVRDTVTRALSAQIMPREGAAVGFTLPTGITPITPPAVRVYQVAVHAAGEQYLTIDKIVQVILEHRPTTLNDAEALYFSNDPERLTAPGTWYEADLEPGKVTRFFFHHLNDTKQRMRLVVQLINPNGTPLSVQVTDAVSGPSTDELAVGHAAVRAFLLRQRGSVSAVCDILPERALPLVSLLLLPGRIADGVWDLRLLGASGARLRLGMVPDTGGARLDAILPPAPPERRGSAFAAAVRRQARYEVGGHWAFVRIGDGPSSSSGSSRAQPRDGERDGTPLPRGGYGVIHDVSVEVFNPLSRRARVEIDFAALGGAARGVIFLGTQMIETPLVRGGQSVRVYEFELEPGETRTVNLRLMPQGGSNYPINIVVKDSGR